jgi:hypothetical protein
VYRTLYRFYKSTQSSGLSDGSFCVCVAYSNDITMWYPIPRYTIITYVNFHFRKFISCFRCRLGATTLNIFDSWISLPTFTPIYFSFDHSSTRNISLVVAMRIESMAGVRQHFTNFVFLNFWSQAWNTNRTSNVWSSNGKKVTTMKICLPNHKLRLYIQIYDANFILVWLTCHFLWVRWFVVLL